MQAFTIALCGAGAGGPATGGAKGAEAMSEVERRRRAEEVRAIIERYADAWSRADLRALQDCYHDDFALNYFGRNALTGRHEGKARALATLAEFSRRTQRRLVKIVATMAGSERGGVIARERFGRAESEVEVERLLVYSIAEGRLRECWVYDADSELVDRFVGAA